MEMLSAVAEQGIDYIAATSHFYPWENSPTEFLKRRESAYKRLKEARKDDMPHILLGAEVYYFDGIGSSENIEWLRIEGTPLLLLEMPFCRWTDRMVEDVIRLQNRRGITVLMAHIERYMKDQKMSVIQEDPVWDHLRSAGVLMQCNASFFLHWQTRHKAMWMLRSKRVHILGSDAHGVHSRPPELGDALQVIGEDGRRHIRQNIRRRVPALWKMMERNNT